MTTPCELTAPEREHYEETVRALERRIDEMRAEALSAFRERYDCEDEATPADLIRRCLESEAAEHERFKARGGELDRLESERDALADRLAIAERAAREEREARIAAERTVEQMQRMAECDADRICEAVRRASRYRLRLARVLRYAQGLAEEVETFNYGRAWSRRALSGGKGE